jgi:hypothetical protein
MNSGDGSFLLKLAEDRHALVCKVTRTMARPLQIGQRSGPLTVLPRRHSVVRELHRKQVGTCG